MIGSNITRVVYKVLEGIDNNDPVIQLRQWVGAWKSNASPDVIESIKLPSAGLMKSCVMQLERELYKSFSMRFVNSHGGEAYRGPFTRVDVIKAGDTWRIGQYYYGWLPGSKAHKTEIRSVADTDIEDIEIKLREHGFERINTITCSGTMQVWQNTALEGARKPINTKRDILHMRDYYRPVQANLAFELEGSLPMRSRTNVHPAVNLAAQEL